MESDGFDSKLLVLLKQRREIDLAIAKLIAESTEGVRFSEKKFVGDLGEYYFSHNTPACSKLTQSITSNGDFDFKGELTDEGSPICGLPSGDVRIEVKTRHAQEGNNHIFGLHPEKFDLLAFVALSGDFSCLHIGMIRSIDITVDRQKRIRYSDYYRKGLVRWKTSDWVEL